MHSLSFPHSIYQQLLSTLFYLQNIPNLSASLHLYPSVSHHHLLVELLWWPLYIIHSSHGSQSNILKCKSGNLSPLLKTLRCLSMVFSIKSGLQGSTRPGFWSSFWPGHAFPCPPNPSYTCYIFFCSFSMLSLKLLYYLLFFPRIWIPLIFHHWFRPNTWVSIQTSPSQSGLPSLPNLKHSSSLYHPVLFYFHTSTYYYLSFPRPVLSITECKLCENTTFLVFCHLPISKNGPSAMVPSRNICLID